MGQAVINTVQCRHMGKPIGVVQTLFGRETQWACNHKRHQNTTAALCMPCKDYLRLPDPTDRPAAAAKARAAGRCQHPTGVCVDRYGKDARVADLYKGASAFLILGGPSTKTMPLHLLGRRGVLIMSVNNCPAVLPRGVRPHIWLHTDGPQKFHNSIWHDPGVLKFAPINVWKLGKGGKQGLRRRNADGQLERIEGVCAKDMPGLFGFERNTIFDPDNWLYEPAINRGNDEESATGVKKGQKVAEPNGWPNVINTMFAAVRLAFYLGIKTLYLVGADFHMEGVSPYGFEQGKSDGGVRSNNFAYAKMCAMFDALRPHFEEAGFEVFNCTPESHFWSFDSIDFEEAIDTVTRDIDEELNTEGWYDDDKSSDKSSPSSGACDAQSAAR